MTAVLRLNLENRFPTLIGDMLLSTTSSAATLSRLPTFKDPVPLFPATATRFPSGLCQKVALVGKDFVIAWSGNYGDAKDAITYLHSMYHNGDLTFQDLDGYLRSLGDKAPGFLGFLNDEKGGYHSFGYRYQRRHTKGLGQLGFLGSGSDSMDAIVKQVEELPIESMLQSERGKATLGDKGIAAALMIAGSQLGAEAATGDSLQNAFGGGYEIAYPTVDGYRKLDGIT